MNIVPSSIEQDGPGIDLSEQATGVAIQMSDPVADFEYALNAVTLSLDLSVFDSVRLTFSAMEFGDEPHAPPASPFADGVNFDGVAISEDGVDWYEIQDLRSLRSDRFTSYDLDLDAVIAGLGLSYNSAFKVRFCQYDNNPAPKDGIFLQGIALTGDSPPPMMHLMMDDNSPNAVVVDSGTGGQDQTFLDPGGDPNTDAHSVVGAVGGALMFDGVDDAIDISGLSVPIDQDCAISLWYRLNSLPGLILRSFGNYVWNASGMFLQQETDGRVRYEVMYTGGIDASMTYVVSTLEWNHFVIQRNGGVIEFHVNGELVGTYSDNPVQLLTGQVFHIGATINQGNVAISVDDFRIYERALVLPEIVALSTTG